MFLIKKEVKYTLGSLKIVKLKDAQESLKERVDQFICSNTTTGEFINCIEYLSYHPKERFTDDSIIVVDEESMMVRGVMMAARSNEDKYTVISHPGTTFAGPIISYREGIGRSSCILAAMLDYYEREYDCIQIRGIPEAYSGQPCARIEFFLESRGYVCKAKGLSNVVDLTGLHTESDLLTLYWTKRRNQVKRVIKSECFQVQRGEIIRKDVWDNLSRNLKMRFQTWPTHSFNEINDLQNRFPNRIVPYYACTYDGKYGAFALVYKFKHVYHTQYLDLNYECAKDYPNLLLIHELMRDAIHHQYSVFSFGVSTEKEGAILNEGLFEYKVQFGGGEIRMPFYEWRRSSCCADS